MLSSVCNADSVLGGREAAAVFSDKLVVAMINAGSVGDLDEVKLLVSKGANVNAVGSDGSTPLIWVLNSKNNIGIEVLLRAGADPNLVVKELKVWPMYFVSMGNDPDALSLLLKYRGNPNHPGNGDMSTRPLTAAAFNGRLENMKLLIEAGADVNSHDEFNESAAVSAVTGGHFDAALFLLKNGYTYNLAYLKRFSKIRVVPAGSEAQRWKDSVLEFLTARGIN